MDQFVQDSGSIGGVDEVSSLSNAQLIHGGDAIGCVCLAVSLQGFCGT